MAASGYSIKISADTKEAADKLRLVKGDIKDLTSNSHDIRLNVDANAIRNSIRGTREIASNLEASRRSAQQVSSTELISGNTLSSATSLAAQFYGIRKDVNGINRDLGTTVQKINVSEFMRTNEFLDKLVENGRGRTKDIAEIYKNIRELPGTEEALGPVENFARAKAWETYGGQIADATVQGAKQALGESIERTKGFFYKDLVDEFNVGLNNTIDTLARVGLALQGVQLLVGPLAAAWGKAFDAIIGQNIRLEQTILSTQTTLASTGRIIDKETGQELIDPLQKIQALEGSVRAAIESIRIRSLELAGVTSQQIIDIFGVVATSISQINGDLKDAEDLAISFTAALGTLGIPFYQARQEIGSILGGYITEDSLLAKRLQISNQDIARAKNSVDGVVGYLQNKLKTAVAGQAIQAKGFAGVTSNIQEIFEVIAQTVGAPLLKPLVDGLTVVYNFLQKIQGIVTEVGGYLSKTLAKTIYSIASIFSSTKLASSIGEVLKLIEEPYKKLAFAIELGFGKRGQNLVEEWLSGAQKIPAVFKPVLAAISSISNFISLQIELITEPIRQFIDQTRELSTISQRAARIISIPFGNFLELTDTFYIGWDTLTSTINEAGKAVVAFGSAIVKLKIVEITSQIRAAAKVFEVFGSMLLGKLNLALAFFNVLGSVLNSEIAQTVVTIMSINKLVQSTDFFGIKDISIWALRVGALLRQLGEDAKLFVKGFKDAGNVENLLANVQGKYADLFKIEANPFAGSLKNTKEITILEDRLDNLNALQKQMAAGGAGPAAMEKYSEAIKLTEQDLAKLVETQQDFIKKQGAGAVIQNNAQRKLVEGQIESLKALRSQMIKFGADTTSVDRYADKIRRAETQLAQLKKTQESFTAAQKAGALLQGRAPGLGVSKEVEAARDAARQAQVMASGAASAKALEGALDSLRIKLGMSKEEFKSLGGAAKAAGKSIQTFLSVSAWINIGFTALSLAISYAITQWQQYEERLKAARRESMKMASVSKILSSGWSSIIEAAEGGDIASQSLLNSMREDAQAAINIQQEKRNKLAEEYQKINDKIYVTTQRRNKLEKAINDELERIAKRKIRADDPLASINHDALRNLQRLNRTLTAQEKEKLKILEQQKRVNIDLDKARRAAALLSAEEGQVRQFDVLSERRKDLEVKIAQIREDFMKEVTDKEFQIRIEGMGNEQQIRNELIEQEKRALSQRLQLLSANAVDQEKKGIQFIQNYKTGLLDAVKSEEQRRTDLQIREAQARKAIEDYAFKMAREKIRLEKELGGYQKQMEQYKNKQTEIRIQKQINAARQQAIIAGPSFEPTSTREQQEFINATQKAGLNHQYAFAALNLLGKDYLQLSGLETAEYAVEKLKNFLDQREKRNLPNDLGTLAKTYLTNEFEPSLIEALKQYAVKVFNTGRFFRVQNQSELEVPDLNIDYAGMERRIAAAENEAVSQLKRLQEVQRAGDKASLDQTLKDMSDASNFTDIKLDYSTEIDKSDTALNSLIISLQTFDQVAGTTAIELEKVHQLYRGIVRGTLRDSQQKGILTSADVNYIARSLSDIANGKLDPDDKRLAGVLNKLDKDTMTVLTAFSRGLTEATERVERVSGQLVKLSKSDIFNERLARSFGKDALMEATGSMRSGAISRLREMINANRSDQSYSLQNTNKTIVLEALFKQMELIANLPFAPTADQLAALDAATKVNIEKQLTQAATLDKTNQALENLAIRSEFARLSAQSLTDAHKEFARSLLSGKVTLEEAFSSFAEKISQDFTNMFIDYAMRPLKNQMEEQFKKLFGVESAQDQAMNALRNSGIDLTRAATSTEHAAAQTSQAAADLASAAMSIKSMAQPAVTNPESTSATSTSGTIRPGVVPFSSPEAQSSELAKAEADYAKSIVNATEVKNQEAKQGGDTAVKQMDFGKALSGATQAFGAIAMGIAGAQQMGKGGTYNTLMGLAGIFGALGSITGMFGTGGVFARPTPKASGGPIKANRPYIVGEIGPELFLPNSDGEIVSNAKSRKLMSAAALAGKTNGESSESPSATALAEKSRTLSSNTFTKQKNTPSQVQFDFAYQSEVINKVEYVTADQFRKGMADSAERGKNMAFQFMQNSVTTRRRLGL